MDNRIFLLCRSTEKVYAQRMLDKGCIFFNYPINWIKKAQEERKEGQGDLLEGVYAEDTTENRKLRPDYEQSDEVEGKIYLRSKSIVNKWLCTCFYSVSDGTLAKHIDGTLKSEIDESYVKAFNKGNKHEPFQKLTDDEKMETVVIKDPDAFLQKVRRHFDNNNLIENKDYFMRLVAYRNENEPFLPIDKPYELFSKREGFKLQQEYRIALNPERPKVQAMLKDGREIFIGKLDDYACIKPFFYDGASISVDLNGEKMHISRWEALSGVPLHKWKFQQLLDFWGMSHIYKTSFTLDGRKAGRAELWKEISNVLSSKYRVAIGCGTDIYGRSEMPIMIRGGDSYDEIMKNEEEDLYYYLRKKPNVYEAPTFGELEVMWPSGIMRFPHIVYQDKLTTSVKPAKGAGDGIP